MNHTYPVASRPVNPLPDAVAELIDDRVPDLGPGTPNEPVRVKLAALSVPNTDAGRALLSALWLLHDFLHESHEISQELETPTGSLLHGIMHRREPDAFNAKYWFRRLGNHPALAVLKRAATELGYANFDPAKFVDDCERERGTGSERKKLLMAVQAKELEVLIGWLVV